MIDHALVLRGLGASLVLVLISATTAWLGWQAPAVAGGLLLGFALGAIPFASWAWIASRGLSSRRTRILTIFLAVAKLALYSGLLYLLITHEIVNPVAVMIGLTAVVFVVTGGTLIADPARAKGAA